MEKHSDGYERKERKMRALSKNKMTMFYLSIGYQLLLVLRGRQTHKETSLCKEKTTALYKRGECIQVHSHTEVCVQESI